MKEPRKTVLAAVCAGLLALSQCSEDGSSEAGPASSPAGPPGTALPAPYDVDPLGKPRASWTRGAYELSE